MIFSLERGRIQVFREKISVGGREYRPHLSALVLGIDTRHVHINPWGNAIEVVNARQDYPTGHLQRDVIGWVDNSCYGWSGSWSRPVGQLHSFGIYCAFPTAWR